MVMHQLGPLQSFGKLGANPLGPVSQEWRFNILSIPEN
jgi:hypothetical protein